MNQEDILKLAKLGVFYRSPSDHSIDSTATNFIPILALTGLEEDLIDIAKEEFSKLDILLPDAIYIPQRLIKTVRVGKKKIVYGLAGTIYSR